MSEDVILQGHQHLIWIDKHELQILGNNVKRS